MSTFDMLPLGIVSVLLLAGVACVADKEVLGDCMKLHNVNYETLKDNPTSTENHCFFKCLAENIKEGKMNADSMPNVPKDQLEKVMGCVENIDINGDCSTVALEVFKCGEPLIKFFSARTQ